MDEISLAELGEKYFSSANDEPYQLNESVYAGLKFFQLKSRVQLTYYRGNSRLLSAR